MNIHYKEFENEVDNLIEFLTSDTWDFHSVPNPKPEKIKGNYLDGAYTGEDNKTIWVISEQNENIGMIRIYDLEDSIPLLDIRILSKYRGLGIGTIVVNWITQYIFNNYSDKERIESYTRQDNYAMRCVFHKCGFLKEAQHRKAWSDNKGNKYDSIGYGITKEDWESGKTTPVNWNDFKY